MLKALQTLLVIATTSVVAQKNNQYYAFNSGLSTGVFWIMNNSSPYFVNLDINGNYNTFYDVSCLQSFSLGGSSCFEYPTYTLAAWNLSTFSQPVANNTNFTQGGFNVTGNTLINMEIQMYDASFNLDVFDMNVTGITRIWADAWLYGYGTGYGVMSISPDSQVMVDLERGNEGIWCLNSGPLADQSYAGGSVPNPDTSPPFFALGGSGSSYSSIW